MQSEMIPMVERCLRKHGIADEAQMVDLFNMKDRTRRQREAVEKLVERQVPYAEAFARHFVRDKFGPATTHWNKLRERIERGVGSPCPLLLIGLPATVVVE